MKTAYIHLIKYALRSDCTVSVWDGEEWSTRRSRKFRAICEDVKGLEEAQLVIRDSSGEKVGWALVSAYGLAPDETVIDHTVNEFMGAWADEFDRVSA